MQKGIDMQRSDNAGGSRRDFIKASTATLAAASLVGSVHAAGAETLKVALVGCGGRGGGAAENACMADKRVRIVALADVFQDRLDEKKNHYRSKFPEQATYTDEHCFLGFDAYQKVLALDLDYVIFATPPHFRPAHIAAAIAAGKNVFTEKPVAVDAPGCRLVMQAGDMAKQKGLSIVAGTQRRHQAAYQEAFKRIQDGQIGKIIAARCYWNQSQLWHKTKQSNWSDMEWMIRDWVNWRWLSGDHICEQHVHNLDVINWFLGKHPVKAMGVGGRAHRPTGDQYDFFAVDYTFEDGVQNASYCRQINGCTSNVSETVFGDKGTCYTHDPVAEISGEKAWRYAPAGGRGNRRGKRTEAAKADFRDQPYVQEHVDLIDSIVNKKGLNEAHNVATSTMTAVMGRIAAYTGRTVTWDEMMKDTTRLGPESYDWNVQCPKIEIPVAGRA